MVRRQRCYDTKLGRSRNFEGTFVSAPAAMEAAFHTRVLGVSIPKEDIMRF